MKIRLDIEGKNEGSLYYKGPDCAELALKYLNSIEADEVRIHLANDDGTRADAEFSGEFLIMSATKFIISAVKSNMEIPAQTSFSTSTDDSQTLTLKERLEMFLRFEYPRVWFSSLDVKRQYESVYGKINLSTVSTYLARMYRDNILERRGNRTQREYRFKDENNLLDMEYILSK
jgi:hypothetical protein